MAERPHTEDKTGGPIAFVFAGGSSLGAIQVGMLRALMRRGIAPDFVVGSSAGAINAAYFACNPTASGVDEMERLWRALKREDIFDLSPLRSLWRLILRHGHMVSPAGLERTLSASFSARRLENGTLPCCIVTTDMLTGCEYRIRSGPAVPALIASAAIPGVFPPLQFNGKYLVDGGVTSHTPLPAAVDLGARLIYVLPTGHSCALPRPPRTAIGSALHGLNLLIVQQLKDAVRHCQGRAEIRIVPPPCPQDVSPYDFSRAGELIERADGLTEQWLVDGVEMVDGVPHQLTLHRHDDVANPFGPYWH
jgi:NTE family protein